MIPVPVGAEGTPSPVTAEAGDERPLDFVDEVILLGQSLEDRPRQGVQIRKYLILEPGPGGGGRSWPNGYWGG